MARYVLVVLCALLIAAPVCFAQDKPIKTDKEKLSYSLGYDLGQEMKKIDVSIDDATFFKGFKDSLSGAKPALTEKEMVDTMQAFQADMQKKQQEKMKVVAEKNKKDAEAFLAQNKTKEGVKTTASGLQYKVVKEGTGESPKITDTVEVNYKGTLLDGTEFDSSYKRGQPAVFPIRGVIPGWTEALQLMKPGAKFQLFIPPALAYGERPAGPVIGPNSLLIFEVELLAIKPKEAAPAGQTQKPAGKAAPKKPSSGR